MAQQALDDLAQHGVVEFAFTAQQHGLVEVGDGLALLLEIPVLNRRQRQRPADFILLAIGGSGGADDQGEFGNRLMIEDLLGGEPQAGKGVTGKLDVITRTDGGSWAGFSAGQAIKVLGNTANATDGLLYFTIQSVSGGTRSSATSASAPAWSSRARPARRAGGSGGPRRGLDAPGPPRDQRGPVPGRDRRGPCVLRGECRCVRRSFRRTQGSIPR